MFHLLVPESTASKDPAFLRRLISKSLPGTGPRFCSGFRTAWTPSLLVPELGKCSRGGRSLSSQFPLSLFPHSCLPMTMSPEVSGVVAKHLLLERMSSSSDFTAVLSGFHHVPQTSFPKRFPHTLTPFYHGSLKSDQILLPFAICLKLTLLPLRMPGKPSLTASSGPSKASGKTWYDGEHCEC